MMSVPRASNDPSSARRSMPNRRGICKALDDPSAWLSSRLPEADSLLCLDRMTDCAMLGQRSFSEAAE